MKYGRTSTKRWTMRNEFQEMVLGAAQKHKVRNNSGKKVFLVFVLILLFSTGIAAIVYLWDHPVKFPPSKPKLTDQEKKEKVEVTKLAKLSREQEQPVKKAEQNQERPAQPKPAERPSEPKAPEPLPQLDSWQIEIGKSYLTDGGSGAVSFIGSFNTWAKVQQIIDDDNMLIDITND